MPLVARPNVYDDCLFLLQHYGFQVSLTPVEADDRPDEWLAERDGFRLYADNPIELLGLAALFLHQRPTSPEQPYWWNIDGAHDGAARYSLRPPQDS